MPRSKTPSAAVLARRALKPRPKRLPRVPGTDAKILGPGAGRPTRYTPEIGAEIARGVESVGFLAVAAETVGVHRQTAYNWQR